MSDEGFEKGLKLLLNNAYDRPEPDESFRTQLLERLRDTQTRARSLRRRKIVTLYTTCATAAAAAFVISLVPLVSPAAKQARNIAAIPPLPALSASDLNARQFSTRQKPPVDALLRESRHAPVLSTGAVPVSMNATGTYQNNDNHSAATEFLPASSVSPAKILSLAGQPAHAINAIDIRNGASGDWTNLKAGSKFTLQKGMEIRTPVGAVDPVTIAVHNGALLMLDGMSRVNVGERDLRLQDGRAVLSLTHSKLALGMQLAQQTLALQPGAMAFMRVEEGDDYAQNGAPAPVFVLLTGQALPLSETGGVRGDAGVLTAQKVYELYNTGTGRYPSRELGSYENQQRFQPMINAITIANEY